MVFEPNYDDVVRIMDVSAIPFSGFVFFPLVARVLNAADDAKRLKLLPGFTADTDRCPIANAKVCLHDYDTGEQEMACTHTDFKGEYTLATSVGIRVSVTVTLGEHVFQLTLKPGKTAPEHSVLPSAKAENGVTEVFDVKANADPSTFQDKVDFADITGQVINMGVHGTRCKYSVGTEAIFAVAVPGGQCTPRSVMEISFPSGVQVKRMAF